MDTTEHGPIQQPSPRCKCFQCPSGCIHLLWGCVTLTLTPHQFAKLASAVSQMFRELQARSECEAITWCEETQDRYRVS